jgi:hypothetical protein
MDVSEEHITTTFTYETLSLISASVGFSLGVYFDPENEGGTLLRNVGLCPNYTAVITSTPVMFSLALLRSGAVCVRFVTTNVCPSVS